MRVHWLAVGARVELRGSHSYAGERGEVVARPGAFYGWAVRLDSGVVVGADERQMRPERGVA